MNKKIISYGLAFFAFILIASLACSFPPIHFSDAPKSSNTGIVCGDGREVTYSNKDFACTSNNGRFDVIQTVSIQNSGLGYARNVVLALKVMFTLTKPDMQISGISQPASLVLSQSLS
jgi:hypothetical protein